jgi:hypothetical protein
MQDTGYDAGQYEYPLTRIDSDGSIRRAGRKNRRGVRGGFQVIAGRVAQLAEQLTLNQ